ncbi:LPD7 domain-containing protein [Sedimentitalea sp.]|uniref:LPD7 domain-containing protein n=1 Tax=Sedimentitalea sp. TaxID=2048915 RepID=UPI00329A7C8D
MPEAETSNTQSFTLSEAHSGRVEQFATAAEAGRAFADADPDMRPHVMETTGNASRTVARTVAIADKIQKSVPTLDTVRTDPVNVTADGTPKDGLGKTNVEFWTAFHAREKEKTQQVTEAARAGQTSAKIAPTLSPALKPAPDGSAEPTTPQPAKTPDERFSMPASFLERFILTKEADRQELFRSYDDKRPAISDRGESLHTKSADRSTAMDMIELVAHRGWSSMRVKGPEEFRREMWIEGTAQGIKVQGYRPNDKDRAEAKRRAEMIGDRVIERTDRNRTSNHQPAESVIPHQPQGNNAANVVPMIDYKKGIEGKITEVGTAPYRDREGAAKTPYVALDLPDGRSHKLWGVALPDMIEQNQLKVGDKATIHDIGKKTVTVKEHDPRTGEESDKQTFRREWGVRDIERAPERESDQVAPAQHRVDSVVETAAPRDQGKEVSSPSDVPSDQPEIKPQPQQASHTDRLEERLTQKDAAKDPMLRGAASTISRLEAEMLAADIPEKDRAEVRALASQELAQGLRAGRTYDVQRLANVSKSQIMATRSLNARDIAQIVEQARVRTPPTLPRSAESIAVQGDRVRELAPQPNRARDR